MARYTNDDLDREVLYILSQHVGKGSAVNRWEMVRIIFGAVAAQDQNDGNPRDRDIREAVSRLRAKGHLICDLGDGHGRYLASNEKEFWELYNYYLKPLRARAAILKEMKKAAVRRWPDVMQPSLFGDELEAL